MKRTLRYVVLFMTSTLVGLSASVATSAEAWIARVHASACMTLGGVPIDNLFGIQNDSTVATMAMLCPAHDQTGQLKGSTTGLGMTVFDDSTAASVTAFACGSLLLGRGGSCAPSAATGASFLGVSLLGISTAGVWIDDGLATSYGYFVVLVPPKQGTAFRSSLQGFQQTGT